MVVQRILSPWLLLVVFQWLPIVAFAEAYEVD